MRRCSNKVVVEFIQKYPFKYRLFIQQYNRVYGETEIVARTIEAVQVSTEVMAVIGTESEY